MAESIGTELLLQGMHAHVSQSVSHHTARDRFYHKLSLRVGRGGRHVVEQHQYLSGAALRIHTQHLGVDELLRALQMRRYERHDINRCTTGGGGQSRGGIVVHQVEATAYRQEDRHGDVLQAAVVEAHAVEGGVEGQHQAALQDRIRARVLETDPQHELRAESMHGDLYADVLRADGSGALEISTHSRER